MIPALMITHGRWEYTNKAIRAALESDIDKLVIIDNGSGPAYQMALKYFNHGKARIFTSDVNNGIAWAMNMFLDFTVNFEFVAKIDNDTEVPKDFCARMLPHMENVDIAQAKHHIIKETCLGGWDEFTKDMRRVGNTLINHFIGGSGIMCRRAALTKIPETKNKIMGWREWQKAHPLVRKGFAMDCEIKLLDENGYEDYPEYYKTTGRC